MMNTDSHHFRVISGAADDGSSDHLHTARHGPSVAALVVMALVLLIGTINGTFSGNSIVDTVVHSATPAPGPTEEVVYFPSQYINQATKIEEHIQAF
jgi:hypothetical protein